MDCPAGTVMSRLYRGRKILQGLLYQYAVEQGVIKDSKEARDAAEASAAQPAAAAAGADEPVDIASYRRRRQLGESS
jgi:RNA polymerase sigma-70 factor (ECF subfamily)